MEKEKKKLLVEKLREKLAIVIRTKRAELGKSQETFGRDSRLCDRSISFHEHHEKLMSTPTLFMYLINGIIAIEDIEKICSEIKETFKDLFEEYE